MGVYKVRNPDGTVTYTGSRPTSGRYEKRGADGRPTRRDAEYDHAQVKKAIGEVRKRVPKLVDYLEYLSYLRNYQPIRLEQALRDLQRADPAAWTALQKYPQFRPNRETALGLKAANRHLEAGVGFAGGNFTGTVEKWVESTLKDMMRRDRFGPYADVLGSKGTPGSARPKTRGMDEKWQAQVARDLETTRAAVRASKATAVTRGVNPLVDLGLEALNPDRGRDAATIASALRMRRMYEAGLLDEEQFQAAQNLLAQGKYREMRAYLDSLDGN